MEVLCMNGRSIAVAKALTEAKEKVAETLQVPPDAVKILHQGEVFEEAELPEHGELLAVVDQARLVLGRHWARMEMELSKHKSQRDQKETLYAELDSRVRRVLELQPLELIAKAWRVAGPCWQEDLSVSERFVMLDHAFHAYDAAIKARYLESDAWYDVCDMLEELLNKLEEDLLALGDACPELLREFRWRMDVWQEQDWARTIAFDQFEFESWNLLKREREGVEDLTFELPGYVPMLESTCPRLSRRETWECKGSKKLLKAKAQERRRTRKPERALKSFHGLREGC